MQFYVRGSDMNELRRDRAMQGELGAVKGLVDLDTTYRGGKPEVGIHIDRDRAADLGVLIATFGHELQHALEVADAPEVVSLASFAAFCAQRGKPNKPGHFETQAAQQVAKRIRTELSRPHEPAGAHGFIVGNLPKQSIGSNVSLDR